MKSAEGSAEGGSSERGFSESRLRPPSELAGDLTRLAGGGCWSLASGGSELASRWARVLASADGG